MCPVCRHSLLHVTGVTEADNVDDDDGDSSSDDGSGKARSRQWPRRQLRMKEKLQLICRAIVALKSNTSK